MVIKLLTKKFIVINDDTKHRIAEANHDELKRIIENILDIEDLEEAMRYIIDNKK